MNITNQKECIAQWESDFIQTGEDTLIPEEDRARVLHELDVLYEELYTLCHAQGVTVSL